MALRIRVGNVGLQDLIVAGCLALSWTSAAAQDNSFLLKRCSHPPANGNGQLWGLAVAARGGSFGPKCCSLPLNLAPTGTLAASYHSGPCCL